jgi:NAD(P)-dependent dehydrogenase (short-subunit alcohol dehydrogenase family)
VARHVDRLRTLARALTDESGRSVETLAADLTNAQELAEVENVLKTDASVTLLVNNACIGEAAPPLLQADVQRIERMIALNGQGWPALRRRNFLRAGGGRSSIFRPSRGSLPNWSMALAVRAERSSWRFRSRFIKSWRIGESAFKPFCLQAAAKAATETAGIRPPRRPFR